MAVINGTDNSETLVGTTDADSISGAVGQDTIYGGRGNDTLLGGADNDSLGGAVGSDYLDGGAGNDTLLGDGVAINPANYPSSGPDNNATGQITNNSGFSVDLYQIDTVGQLVFKGTIPNGATWSGVTGANYNWVLTVAGSTTPIEVIFGAQSYTFAPTFNDTILGGTGQDSIDGGLGNDSIIGGVDNDTSGGDNDTIWAGDGNDTVRGVTGNDWVNLGEGNDVFGSVTNEGGNDTVYGGGGNDSIIGGEGDDVLYGDAGRDTLAGSVGNDQMYGGTGNDSFSVTDLDGFDVIDGGEEAYDADIIGFSTANTTQGVIATFTGTGSGNYDYVGAGNAYGNFSGIDALIGTDYADTLDASGDAGGVSLYGWTGNDLITGGSGADSLLGEDGDDTLSGGAGNDTLTGGAGNDSLSGGADADQFWIGASEGVDTISGGETGIEYDFLGFTGAGVNVLFSGTEAGTYSIGTGTGSFTGIEGVWGTAYADTIDASANQGTVTVKGFDGDDRISGGTANDFLEGNIGNDTVSGGLGHDTLTGGDGNDLLDAGDGNDSVFGDSGNDTLIGGLGDDYLSDTYGDDLHIAGDGNDRISDNYGNDTIDAGAGNDSVNAGEGDDRIDGGTGNDSLAGGGGNDTLAGGVGADTLDGGSGLDFADYSGSDAAVTVNLTAMTVTGGHATGDVLLNGIDGAYGSAYDDVLIGYDQAWTGVDPYANVFYGNAGNDLLSGLDGADSLYGGDDNDTLIGGGGNDLLDGGGGADQFLIGAADGLDTIAGGETGTDQDQIVFSDAAATVTFTGAEAGTYAVGASKGSFTQIERITGGTQNDSFNASASGAAVTLDGGAGNDTLQGGAAGDQLNGGLGNDLLIGREGADTITTGDGADVVALTVDGGGDLITDFNMTPATGSTGPTVDQLDVSELRTAEGMPVTWADVIVSSDAVGNAVLSFPGGETLVLQGVTPDQVDSKQEMANIGIPCFSAGTRVLTPAGWRRVEDLRAGDSVTTDTGPRPILWAGGRRLAVGDLETHPEWRPIVIRAGALGNARPLTLSPQHCVVMLDRGQEVLLRARHAAAELSGAFRVAQGRRSVHYLHLLLPQHALICAEGAWVESLWPGRVALAALGPVAVRSMLAAAPQLAPLLVRGVCAEMVYGPMCRPLLSRSAVAAARHRLCQVQPVNQPA